MAVPTYDELLARKNIKKSTMRQPIEDKHLREFSLSLDIWERLARHLEIPNTDIRSIKSHGDEEEQRDRMLECWKQRCGSGATYEELVKVLLRLNRTDLAEKVTSLRLSKTQPIPLECGPVLPPPQAIASSSGIENMSSGVHCETHIVSTLKKLEEEFFQLVTFVEDALENSMVDINTITRRFRMLPQSVKRQQETDKDYKETRRRILNSTTIKDLFDNLTELKHWNYMLPDVLMHIVQDVKINDIHQKIEEYKEKLSTFKSNTKLRDLTDKGFPVPDYCIELTVKVEGWEDKTIEEAEKMMVNLMREATHGQSVHLGWKKVTTGSLKMTFIFTESTKIGSEIIPKDLKKSGVMSVQVDGDILYSEHYMKTKIEGKNGKMLLESINSETVGFIPDIKRNVEKNILYSEHGTEVQEENREHLSGELWQGTHRVRYNAGGRRDVLIIASDLSSCNPEVVMRIPGQPTVEDKQMLLSQGIPHGGQNELAIIKARYALDKRYDINGVKLGQLSREEVMESITKLLITAQEDGVVIHYIGAGRRQTGDWCFEDGFITFRDIADLYLRASSNFKGPVLTIISDCSYSGCWVRDCMEFLDDQGVEPCGHKAREKGMIIKVYTSCKSNEIPTEYCYSVNGAVNENTGEMSLWIAKKLSESQTTVSIDSSHIRCSNKNIHDRCTLQPGKLWMNTLS